MDVLIKSWLDLNYSVLNLYYIFYILNIEDVIFLINIKLDLSSYYYILIYIIYDIHFKVKWNTTINSNVIFHNNRSFIIWMKGSTVSIKLISSPRPPFNLTPRYPIIRSKELLYVSYQKSTTFLLREICKTITFHAGKPSISYNVTFVH